MAYTITTTIGDAIGSIPDGELNTTSTSLQLIGRNYSNYGQVTVDDFVWLLENFADTTAPDNPIQGQLWWDTTNTKLKVRVGLGLSGAWKSVNGCTSATVAPGLEVIGDLWWKSDTEQLFIYTGTEWKLIGPSWEKNLGKSGAFWEQILGTDVALHTVLSVYLNGHRLEIFNKEATFTPNAANVILGFSTINQGINANLSINSGTFWGVTDDANKLGSIPAAQFWRDDVNNIGTGTLTIQNDTGLILGADSDATLSVTGDYVRLSNETQDADLSLRVNVNGTPTDILTLQGSDGTISVAADPTSSLGIATKQYVDAILTNTALVGVPTADNAPPGTNNTQLASTAFVFEANSAMTAYVNSLNSSQGVDISGKANIDTPTFIGLPRAPTMAVGTANTTIATTSFVNTANVYMQSYVTSVVALKANIDSPSLTGLPLAPTMPPGSANTTIATTEFVVNNSGFLKNKIYQGNSYIEITDVGTGAANVVIDGTTVMNAVAAGVILKNGAIATTQSQVYNGAGNLTVATTQYAKTAATWWGGSAKFVSIDPPIPGTNDTASVDGDFWFQRED